MGVEVSQELGGDNFSHQAEVDVRSVCDLQIMAVYTYVEDLH